jgi:hypothetical protein
MTDDDLGKPVIEGGNAKVSFMTDPETNKALIKERDRMIEESRKKYKPELERASVEPVAEVSVPSEDDYITLDMLKDRIAPAGRKRADEDLVPLEEINRVLEKAGKDFDKAEAKLRWAIIDAEYEPDEETPEEKGEVKKMPEKELKEHEKECGLCNPDGNPKPEPVNLTLIPKTKIIEKGSKCPKCDSKLKMKYKLIRKGEELYINQLVKCKRNGFFKKCDYAETILERID